MSRSRSHSPGIVDVIFVVVDESKSNMVVDVVVSINKGHCTVVFVWPLYTKILNGERNHLKTNISTFLFL